jgi:hypothetical protein
MVSPSNGPDNAPGNSQNKGNQKKQQQQKGPSQATKLLSLVASSNVHLFHDAEGVAYATFTVEEHRETWRLDSRSWKHFLSAMYWKKYQTAPSADAIAEAQNVLVGKALFGGSEERVALRIAAHEGAILLDLCNAHWQVIEITDVGWRVIDDSPVRFVRRPGNLPLPMPSRNGDVNALRRFINMRDEGSWILTLCWLVAALRPSGPFPVMVVSGEQGSAKSSTCRMLRSLVDPNKSPLRRPPRDERDLMIAAQNSAVLVFENLSSIQPWLSDALCALATGGGFGTRLLYTDDDEKLFDAQRPVMLNGIGDLATRSDLLDRAIGQTLPPIPDNKRIDEAQLKTDFEKARPVILGGLLDAVSTALRNLPTIKIDEKPRMADFFLWGCAAEPAFGCPTGTFAAAYAANREHLNEQAIDDAPIGRVVLEFMEDKAEWSGTATDLLSRLDEIADERTKEDRHWPKRANVLGNALRRVAPNLRRGGVEIEFDREKSRGRSRIVTLRKGAQNAVRDCPAVQNPDDDGFWSDDGSSGECPIPPEHRPKSGADSSSNGSDRTTADGLDNNFAHVSGRHEVRHKKDGCQGKSAWEHVHGGVFCLLCWPATDRKAIRSIFPIS